MSSKGIYRRVILTGAEGLLGAAIAEALRLRGLPHLALTHSDCDVTDARRLEALFDDQRPSLFINCAACAKVDQCEVEPERAYSINTKAVRAIASAAAQHSTFVVHFSTDYVFDGLARTPYPADAAPAPLSVYGASKLGGEQALAGTAGLKWLLIRTSALFGASGNCFPALILRESAAGHPLTVVNDQLTSPTYAPDLADAVFELLDRSRVGMWHIANSGAVTWHEFAQAILATFGRPQVVRGIPTEEWRKVRPGQARRPAYSVLDCAPFALETGHALRPWAVALLSYRTAALARGL